MWSLAQANLSIHTSSSTMLFPTSSAPWCLAIALSIVMRNFWIWWSWLTEGLKLRVPFGHRYGGYILNQSTLICTSGWSSHSSLLLEINFSKGSYIQSSCWHWQLYNAFPILMRRVPGPHHTLQNTYCQMLKLIKTEVDQHKKDWDPSEPRDYIDCYLNEIKKVSGKNRSKTRTAHCTCRLCFTFRFKH